MIRVKKIIVIAFGALVVYLLSFLLIGKSTLLNQLIKDNNSTFNVYEWTDDIHIVSNMEKVGDNLADVGKMFNLITKKVEFVPLEDGSTFNKSDDAKDAYYYFLMLEEFGPYSSVNEGEWIQEYAAFWEKEYVWCFFFWIQTKNEMTGIS